MSHSNYIFINRLHILAIFHTPWTSRRIWKIAKPSKKWPWLSEELANQKITHFRNITICHSSVDLWWICNSYIFLQPESALAVHSSKVFDRDLFYIAPFYHRWKWSFYKINSVSCTYPYTSFGKGSKQSHQNLLLAV